MVEHALPANPEDAAFARAELPLSPLAGAAPARAAAAAGQTDALTCVGGGVRLAPAQRAQALGGHQLLPHDVMRAARAARGS